MGSRLALSAVVIAGVVLRVFPWFQVNTFLGVQEYDDGVYYGAAKFLLHGKLPYRDFTIVHPPGISVLLVPFAALGSGFGDDAGLAAARVAVVAVAAVNLVLVYRLVLRLPIEPGRARFAALSGAGLYALMPNTVVAEHTVLLEPVANLFCLSAMAVFTARQSRSAQILTGVLLVVAVSVKLFAGAYVVAVIVWLLLNGRLRTLAWVGVGLVAGAVTVVLPFVLPAPGAFWHDVVVTQVQRPSDATAQGVSRLLDMLGLRSQPQLLGVVVLALTTGLLLWVGVLAARPWQVGRWAASVVSLWVEIAVLIVVAFSQTQTYFPHYGAFLAPPLAVLTAYALAISRPACWRDRLRVAVLACIAVTFGYGSLHADLQSRGQPDFRLAGAQIPAGTCVFYEAASLAIAANVLSVPTAACPAWVDERGVVYTWSTHWPSTTGFYPQGFVADQRWQNGIRIQMSHAQNLLISRAPTDITEWDQQTRSFALQHFRPELLLTDGGSRTLQLWKRSN